MAVQIREQVLQPLRQIALHRTDMSVLLRLKIYFDNRPSPKISEAVNHFYFFQMFCSGQYLSDI